MTLIDFSPYETTPEMYSGTEKKFGILIGKTKYIIKFQKEEEFCIRNNHISEHIGSMIFSIVGMDVQQTILGTYNGKKVVACKVFCNGDTQFVPFDEVGESSLDTDKNETEYSYEDIMSLLRSNNKLENKNEAITFFWDMFIIDGLLGNFDRHGLNWGFLKQRNKYRIAPVFDNGSCLYPKMVDESQMLETIRSEEKTDEHIYKYPTSKIKIDGKKSSYYEVISSLKFHECNEALLRMYPKIDMKKIEKFITSMDEINEIQKEFYIHMLKARMTKIISYSYEKLMEIC